MSAEVRSLFPLAILRFFQESAFVHKPFFLVNEREQEEWVKKVTFFSKSNRRRLLDSWVRIASKEEICKAQKLLGSWNPKLEDLFEIFVRRIKEDRSV